MCIYVHHFRSRTPRSSFKLALARLRSVIFCHTSILRFIVLCWRTNAAARGICCGRQCLLVDANMYIFNDLTFRYKSIRNTHDAVFYTLTVRTLWSLYFTFLQRMFPFCSFISGTTPISWPVAGSMRDQLMCDNEWMHEWIDQSTHNYMQGSPSGG